MRFALFSTIAAVALLAGQGAAIEIADAEYDYDQQYLSQTDAEAEA